MPTVKIKRLFRVLPWLMALLLGVLFLALMQRQLASQERLWEQRLAQGQGAQQQLIAASQQSRLRELQLLSYVIAQDQPLMAMIRAAYHPDRLADQDHQNRLAAARALLRQPMTTYWKGLSAHNGRQLTIYLPPDAEALYRAHHPQRFGDSSVGIRPMVMEVLGTGTVQSALDVGRHGSAYRTVFPVFAGADNSGPVVAAVELGLGILDPSLQVNGGVAVLMNPSVLKDLLWVRARADLVGVNNAQRGQWLLEDFSGELVRTWAEAALLPNPLAKHPYQLLHWRGRDYLLYSTVLSDFLGATDSQREPLVAILTWRDITAELANHRSRQRNTAVEWLLVLLLIEAVLLLLLGLSGRYVNSLLREHQQNIERERDISESARQQLTLALASSESGFWEWDLVTDRAHFSPQWKKVCGIDESVRTLPDADEWLSRVHPNDKTIAQRDMLRHLKGETPMYETEYRLRTEDGSYRWIYSRGKVVERLPDGKAARVIGVYTDVTSRKEAEVIILRQQAALRSMNEIASLPAVEPEEQLRRALVLGASYLGLPIGIVSEVQRDDYRVRVQISPPGTLKDQDRFDLRDTYCEITLKSDEVIAIDRMSESEYSGHPCYENFKLETYIGVPLYVSGKVYGTLNFSSPARRYHAFDDLDKDFIRLLGRWTGVTIERWLQYDYQQELLQRFRKLSERLPGFLYQYQQRADGSISFPYASAGIEYICGVRLEQALLDSDAVFAVIHPEDLARVKQSIDLSAAQLGLWSVSFRINHPTRGLIWVQGNAKPERLADGSILWHGFLSDITHEKNAELELQAINTLQQAIFDAASVAIISVNNVGEIVVFNRGAELMLGYSAGEMVGKVTPEVFHREDEIITRALELTQELGREVKPGFDVFVVATQMGKCEEREWTYVRKDGQEIPVLLAVSALLDPAGNIRGYVGLARDITELKRAERIKNEFITTVSHELRTPLTAISGALSLVQNGAVGDVPDTMKKMLQIAQKNSERLIYLVNDLLDMEKLVAGKTHFDNRIQLLRPIVEQALETNSAYFSQHQVSFELRWNIGEILVDVDEQRLAQVLANYLSNAAKFSRSGGSVVINAAIENEQVSVHVADTGIGIPFDQQSHIFEKFFQVDSSDARHKGGTGLGLAISMGLVEKMGGSVAFKSVPGQGSTFSFSFPCVLQSDAN